MAVDTKSMRELIDAAPGDRMAMEKSHLQALIDATPGDRMAVEKNQIRSLLDAVDLGRVGYRPGHKDGAYRVDMTGQGKLTGVLAFGKRGRQAADYAACATRSAVCAGQFQGMSSSHRAAGQSAAIFPVTSAM